MTEFKNGENIQALLKHDHILYSLVFLFFVFSLGFFMGNDARDVGYFDNHDAVVIYNMMLSLVNKGNMQLEHDDYFIYGNPKFGLGQVILLIPLYMAGKILVPLFS